jgi:hypothetical protein
MAFDSIRYSVLGGLSPTGVLGGDEPESWEGLPEPLVNATVQAALRISRDQVLLGRALSPQAAWLVAEALRTLGANP